MNGEVISLADSQVLRWIDELNGITDAEERAVSIKREIRRLKSEQGTIQNRRTIRRLYSDLDAVQFKPDYMCLIIDREKDYHRACAGFSINGVTYRRLLGTNGGIKNSTIVFVSERLCDVLRTKIENGRLPSKELVPAKLEAYKALTCSASIPVSMPNGVLIVNDCETSFYADTIYLNDESDGEPEMEYRPNTHIEMDASDGYGIMLPDLAARWSEELGIGYVASGFNTRFSFEKGMVFAFDFIDFAKKIANTYIVKDAWGNEVDIRQVELILTTSMVKLWDSYESCEDYVQKSISNGYTFGIAKACPEELESERNLNYQFIQSYDLDDDDIDELIAPTMQEFRDVIGGDWRKTLLFMHGTNMREDTIGGIEPGITKAIMADRRVLDDPYVKNSIYQTLHNRINEAKTGVLKVHGNYSIVSGDPYALCQSIFGLEVTSLLKAGEIWNRYWYDSGAEKLACFRAPMTCHNNIRLVHPCRSEEAVYWYQYLTTSTVFNAWDTASAALNGCDFDGDLVMLTDNRVLVDKLVVLPALMCVQRKAKKKVPEEQDFIRSNIESFGNDIGRTTNWITSMFEVKSHYNPSDEEYKILEYRIRCGQLYQQNVIDKAKGIIAKPMPREWHDRHAAGRIEDESRRELYRHIVADKKPYFMRYIYPDLMKEYNGYIKNTDRSALREFHMTVAELKKLPYDDLTDRQKQFLHFFDLRMPVGIGDCVMNKICRRFEDEFDGFIGKLPTKSSDFDYRIYTNGGTCAKSQCRTIKKLYDEYISRVLNYRLHSYYDAVDEDEASSSLSNIKQEFVAACHGVCPNDEDLCNVVLDICYARSATKSFAWAMCARTMVNNLLKKNGNVVSFPCRDEDGEIQYCGERFSIKTITLGEMDEYYTE